MKDWFRYHWWAFWHTHSRWYSDRHGRIYCGCGSTFKFNFK
jgi:hypothetical protein